MSCGLVLFSSNAFAGDPIAVGDVVGRELDYPGLGWLGHVGMYTGSGVLEVLQANPVIQINSVASFKQASTYLGAKYGKGFNHSAMIAEGIRQQSYGANYTLSASGTPGYVQRTCIQYGPNGQCAQYRSTNIPGQWRCDSFVNYIYQYVTGQNLVSIMLPKNVLSAYPYFR